MSPELQPIREQEILSKLLKQPPNLRPIPRDQAHADQVLDAMCEGKSLQQVCWALGYTYRSTHYFLRDYHTKAYLEAKAACASYLAGQVLDIADDASKDFVDTDKGPVLDREHVQRSKLRIETRQWYAKMLAPREFGDKLAVGGSDDMPPIKTINAAMTPAEAYDLMLNGKGRLPKPADDTPLPECDLL
jgi:hypothetical protein